MKKILIKSLIMILLLSSVIIGCKKKEIPNTAPQVSTTGISAVTGTTAKGGGNISSDGGATVTISGLCYSKTNQTPTISDDTTKTTATTGSFSSMLKNLQPSTTYYVRAYATNSIGTGYGEVVSFTTGNGAPIATEVSVTGTPRVGEELTAAYTYSDPENNPQSGTTFQWYIATSATGTGEAAIAGATTSKYQVKAVDEFKFIRVSITPKSSAGTANGAEVKSAYVGPVDVESVIFTYNGQQVTYGVITSSVTGRKWLDRNLGAKRAATSFDDYQAYGDLFQWGRSADGHQVINWSAAKGENAGVPVNSATTTIQSTSDSPGHSHMIIYSADNSDPTTVDWRTPQNNELWKGPNYTNNPCPNGWHIPSSEEWNAESLRLKNRDEVFAHELKLPSAGSRRGDTGLLNFDVGLQAHYWTSSASTLSVKHSVAVDFKESAADINENGIYAYVRRMAAYPVRCIKNN